MSGDGGADTLLVLSGTGTLSGGDGPDTIVGGNDVSGGNGSDTIDVSGDEPVDTVDCGAGRDTVYADTTDVIAANCETRLPGPMPTSAAVEGALAHLAEAFGPLGAS